MTTPLIPDIFECARDKGVEIVTDPSVGIGYVVERDPADPTTPGSPDVHDHSFVVRAATAQGRSSGAAQVLCELAAKQTVTCGHHVPRLERRCLHIDAGRHYFSRDELADLVRLASWCRLNVINLHISETHGYRLASARHREVTAAEHLTRDDIAATLELAASYGIRVVPGFDMPGHLDGVLAAHPEFRLKASNGNDYPGALDILNPDARHFVWDLLDEVIEIFSADEVTIGGDEFLDFGEGVDVLEAEAHRRWGDDAGENDVWIAFINDTVARLSARGITAGVYNDGVRVGRVVDLDPAALVHYWTRWGAHMAPPAELARAGHALVNWDGESCYFVLFHDRLDELPTYDTVTHRFDPYTYPDKAGAYHHAATAGATFSIWCDEPDALTSTQVIERVAAPLYAFGERCWPLGRTRTPDAIRAGMDAFAPQPGDNTQQER